ncbi:MAG: DNA polymerase III subunit delta [Calditrichaeota bacterium]|nr:DNA polymerase III subunit delta [Calditrichota bacterium]
MVYFKGKLPLTFAALKKEIAKGQFRPAYLFSGKEDFIAESGVKTLLDSLLKPEDYSLNYFLYYGKDADSLPETLFTPPLFGGMRVTVVRQAQDLAGASLNAVVKYLKNKPKDGCLILWAGEPDLRKKFFKSIKGIVEVVDCKPLSDRELSRWINGYAARFGKEFDSEAVAHLSSINWPNLRELASEIEQLTLMVGDAPVISTTDISEMGGCSFAFDRWTLTDAVGAGDAKTAHEAVLRLHLSGLTPTQIIGDLFRLFNNLWILRYLVDKRKTNEASKSIRLPQFILQKYISLARKTTRNGIEDGILRLHEADLNIKTGNLNGNRELGVLVSSLVNSIRSSS